MTDITRGEVYLMRLNPTRGREIRDIRPCLVVSPTYINESDDPIIVTPMTTGEHPYEARIPCEFRGRPGYVLASQVRSVDPIRIIRRLGVIDAPTLDLTLSTLRDLFTDLDGMRT